MNCKEFQLWLETRDTRSRPGACKSTNHARHLHMTGCRECLTLFQIDQVLEKKIAAAFELEPLPEGFKNNLNLSLDKCRPLTSNLW